MSRAASLLALTAVSQGFRDDRRFAAAPVAASAADPIADAYAEGYAQGLADATQQATARAAEIALLETTLKRLDAEAAADLRAKLHATVLGLCEATLSDAAIEAGVLARRIERAVAMLARAGEERVVRLHPADLALVAPRLTEDWPLSPDPSLPRGALCVEGGNGGVEDGPEQWRRALEEALRGC